MVLVYFSYKQDFFKQFLWYQSRNSKWIQKYSKIKNLALQNVQPIVAKKASMKRFDMKNGGKAIYSVNNIDLHS